MSPEHYLRDAVQKLLNQEGDGWSVHQFVVVMGLERLNPAGEVESTPWSWAPPEQPEWQSLALLGQALDDLNRPVPILGEDEDD